MILFWMHIEINLDPSMPFVNENAQSRNGAKGFFQETGCTADDELEAKQIIMSYLKEIEWLDLAKAGVSFVRTATISPDDMESEVYGDPDIKHSLRQEPLKKGIWYASGKAFFSNELGEDEFYKVKIKKAEEFKKERPVASLKH